MARAPLVIETKGSEDLEPLANTHWRLGLTLEKEGRKAEAIAEMG